MFINSGLARVYATDENGRDYTWAIYLNNHNFANSIGIIIPCHRIIGEDGKLVGFAGGLALKKRVLKLENNLFVSSTNHLINNKLVVSG